MKSNPCPVLIVVLALGVLALCGLLVGACSEPPPALVAYVASAGNNHVQVIDLETGETLRKIYAGAAPWRLELSPDRRRLWVQHWYSATTAVIDLEDHEIAHVLPYRGPGVFTADGGRFLTFNWPTSALYQVDTRSFERLSEQYTEVPRVYDLALDPGGETEEGETVRPQLFMLQHDPMAGRAHRIYAYLLAYPYTLEDPAQAAAVSIRTGYSPVDVQVLSEPFVLTADSETNGLSLLNRWRDGRAVPSCEAPRALLVAPDETRMVVPCWRGDGHPTSRVASYATDFTTRPWPTVTQDAGITIDGAITSGAFTPDGERVLLADRTGARLWELDASTLEVLREIPTGEVPMAVTVVELPARARDRLLEGPSPSRRTAREALAKLQASSAPFTDLAWTETATWFEPDPEADPGAEEEDGASNGEPGEEQEAAADSQKEQAGEEEEDKPPMIERQRTLRHLLRGPGWSRTEAEDGGIRLARGGHTVSIEPDGRFWVTPRQELISYVYALPNLSLDDAVRHLAGDVPGSPFLRAGIALDLAEEVTVNGDRYYILGAPAEGGRTSQLWIDADSGRPINLVEQIPVFRARGHDTDTFFGIVETRFHGFAEAGEGVWLPTQLDRVTDGQWAMEVVLEDVEVNPGLPEDRFSLARLGGETPDGLFDPAPGTARQTSAETRWDTSPDGPGFAVPVLEPEDLENHLAPHRPYTSSPPTSGPLLYDLADWGVHEVPVPLALQVRNLEQGGVAVQYNCPEPCPDLVARLEELVYPRENVLMAPYPWMEARIALTAWGRIETLPAFDAQRIERFLDAYAGGTKSPEEEGAEPGPASSG